MTDDTNLAMCRNFREVHDTCHSPASQSVVAADWKEKKGFERAAEDLNELIALGYTWTYEIAMVHAYRGELDEAFTWLHRAIDRRDRSLGLMTGDPFMNNLRDDPRFDTVLERLGRKVH